MKKIVTCLLTVLGLTTACGQENFENADVKAFAELMENTRVVVLDVRTPAEFTEGHIEGALNIDQGEDHFIEKIKAILPADKISR